MRRSVIGMAVVLGTFAATSPVIAQSLLLGGTQWEPQNSYSYLGAIVPFAGARLGSGWFVSAFADYLTYHYDTGNPSVRVSTKAPGINGGVGYAWQGPAYQLALSASLGYQYFSVQPTQVDGAAIPGPKSDTVTFTPQIQARHDLTSDLYASTIANYSFGQSAYWSRFRGGYQPVYWLSFGPEGILQGGVNYRIRQVGAFISLALGDGWSLDGEGGVAYNSGLPSMGYVGLSFAKAL
ncbi:MAG: cellulose biosynthesis protein BcsS [Sulfuricella sp.]